MKDGACDFRHPADAVSALGPWGVAQAWITPLVKLAAKRPLQAEDVYDSVPKGESAQERADVFRHAWEAEVGHRGMKQASVVRALRSSTALFFTASGISLFWFMVSQLATPFLIRELVAELSADSMDLHFSLLIATGLLISSSCSSYLITAFFGFGRRVGIAARTGLMAAIYEHAMQLSAEGRLKSTIGQTTNLMSVDAEKMVLAAQGIHFLWMTPLQTLIMTGVFVNFIGWEAVPGIALFVLGWPLQRYVARAGGKQRLIAMRYTDERIKFLTEVVHGIRVAKLYAWEEAIFHRAVKCRKQEMVHLQRSLLSKMSDREGILQILPPAALGVIFVILRLRGRTLSTTDALMVLGFLNTLRFPFNLLAFSLTTGTDALVSSKRIKEFLLRSVVASRPVVCGPPVVRCQDAVFSWSASAPEIKVGDLQFSGNGLVAIVGRVAAGKSSLLAGLLGEMVSKTGFSEVIGRVAYMGQVPWIQNMTLRGNILFGQPFDEQRYWAAVQSAALRQDLDVLPGGDSTEIGERGINLSGGQKARVGLARCFYAAACGHDLVVLDSPLSALDVPTGHLVWSSLVRLSKTKLVIIVMSSHTNLASQADSVVLVESGSVTKVGTFESIRELAPALLACGLGPDESVREGAEEEEAEKNNSAAPNLSSSQAALTTKEAVGTGSIYGMSLRFLGLSVGGGLYSGGAVLFALVAVFLAGQTARVTTDVALTRWASGKDGAVVVYTMTSLVVFLVTRVFLFPQVAARASNTLHQVTLMRVLRAPVPTFFDTTTCGEIVNKFAKDLEICDTMLPEFVSQFMSNASQLITIFTIATAAIPPVACGLLVIGFFFVRTSMNFSHVARDIKRLDGGTRGAIYNCFSESLSGLETIRAWGAVGAFVSEVNSRIDGNLRFFFTTTMCENWVMGRLECFSIAIVAGFAFVSVLARRIGAVDAQMVGLALVYAVQLTAMFQRTAQLSIMIQQYMTACERVMRYFTLEQESETTLASDAALPPQWPVGHVSFNSVSIRYRDGPLVLKNVSFEVEAGQRLGVCGRTGAGKSSLLSALFRIVAPESGVISIDGHDICRLGLWTIRRAFSIIPQDPVVFSGTFRANLDPFGHSRDDLGLLDAVRRVGLHAVEDNGLDGAVAERGDNLSVGQRQLLCVARAMVRDSKILLLDEATSSMDGATDAAVQAAIAAHWGAGGKATQITIAHRLSTILDHDRILVLSFGEVAEFGTTQELQKLGGHFAGMVCDAGLMSSVDVPQAVAA
eukprot:CAMPEP_0204372582 /NCGR_PEP_ID=MMETSP0469-20131031/47396_1 /ASSEMBLY_ACC=CAM_ASM_000384 /TAXON_ID=2969 /ORGANISM="Oxyrrhis marina" /LENGTH=1251 /DNA_ID=CAMNT_0051362909 /DNA_START=39 /DNA_END=3794 /DNA_ORIENTATION=-